MTPKQQRFVAEYLIDLNATQAAKRAGYSKKTAGQQGERLLRNVEIQSALKKGCDKIASKAEISAEWVLEGLKKEAERFGEDGSASARVKSYELIGKHIGMFSELTLNLKGKLDTTPQVNVGVLNDKQLRAIQTALAPALAGKLGSESTEAKR